MYYQFCIAVYSETRQINVRCHLGVFLWYIYSSLDTRSESQRLEKYLTPQSWF